MADADASHASNHDVTIAWLEDLAEGKSNQSHYDHIYGAYDSFNSFLSGARKRRKSNHRIFT